MFPFGLLNIPVSFFPLFSYSLNYLSKLFFRVILFHLFFNSLSFHLFYLLYMSVYVFFLLGFSQCSPFFHFLNIFSLSSSAFYIPHPINISPFLYYVVFCMWFLTLFFISPIIDFIFSFRFPSTNVIVLIFSLNCASSSYDSLPVLFILAFFLFLLCLLFSLSNVTNMSIPIYLNSGEKKIQLNSNLGFLFLLKSFFPLNTFVSFPLNILIIYCH